MQAICFSSPREMGAWFHGFTFEGLFLVFDLVPVDPALAGSDDAED